MARASKKPASRAKKKSNDDPVASEIAAAESAGIDGVLSALESVVEDLESGELSLEDALRRFESGVALARRGGDLLSALEERVEMLLADRDETVPFDEEDEDDA